MTTRSLNDGSSSSFMEAGAAEKAAMTASDLETPRASLVNTPTAASDKKTPAKMPAMPTIIMPVTIRPPP